MKSMCRLSYVLLLTLFFACSVDYEEAVDFTPNVRSMFTVELAKDYYEMRMADQTRSPFDDIMPFVMGDPSVCWDRAEVSISNTISSVDIPVEKERRYKVVRKNEYGEEYSVNAYSKFIVVRSNVTEEMEIYMRICIPDESYARRCTGNPCEMTLNCEDRGDYSGLEYYARPDGLPVAVACFRDGELIGSVYLYDETLSEKERMYLFAEWMHDMWIIPVSDAETRAVSDPEWAYGNHGDAFIGDDGVIYVYYNPTGSGIGNSIVTLEIFRMLTGGMGSPGGIGGSGGAGGSSGSGGTGGVGGSGNSGGIGGSSGSGGIGGVGGSGNSGGSGGSSGSAGTGGVGGSGNSGGAGGSSDSGGTGNFGNGSIGSGNMGGTDDGAGIVGGLFPKVNPVPFPKRPIIIPEYPPLDDPKLPADLSAYHGTAEYYVKRLADYYNRYPEREGNEEFNYYSNYGLKYFRKFKDSTSLVLSDAGKVWVDATAYALQVKISEFLKNQPKIESNPENLKKAAFGTHADAYIESGILELPVSDKIWIFLTVDIDDLFSSEGVSQVMAVTSEQINYYIDHPLFAIDEANYICTNWFKIKILITTYLNEQMKRTGSDDTRGAVYTEQDVIDLVLGRQINYFKLNIENYELPE